MDTQNIILRSFESEEHENNGPIYSNLDSWIRGIFACFKIQRILGFVIQK